MNRAKSKYFNTALRMDEAVIALLEKKDFEYITVKEICERAGVNRSTFYLHYETIADLLTEAMETVNGRFLAYFKQNSADFVGQIDAKEPGELLLVTREYLWPYLRFIKDNQNVYCAAYRNPKGTQSHLRYKNLRQYVLEPILRRFGVPAPAWPYYIAYYIEGTAAIIREWLNRGCAEPMEAIAGIIEECVHPSGGGWGGWGGEPRNSREAAASD